jgi:N6-adenosine-specific RNA methylase IME4
MPRRKREPTAAMMSPDGLPLAGALLIDLPWDPHAWSEKGKGRHPSANYDVMSLDEIRVLPIKDYAAPNASVFCWATDQFLDFASWELPRAWGCSYSSVAFVWFKTANRFGRQPPLFLIGDNKDFPMGQGMTTRKNCEFCLLFRYGKFGRQDPGVRQVIFAPRRANSQKPDEQYGLIERLVKGPYRELFARQRWPGWQQAFSPEADSGPSKRRWKTR